MAENLAEGTPGQGENPGNNAPLNPGNPGTPPLRTKNDYFGLKLYGVNDRDIKFMQGDDRGMSVEMMPEQAAYEKYAPMLAQKGTPVSRQQFSKQYAQAQQQFKNFKQGQFDYGSFSEPIYRRTDRGFASDANSRMPISDMDFESHAFNPKDTRYRVQDDKIIQLQSDQEYADQRGIYIPITGPVDEDLEKFTGIKDEKARNRTFTEIEIAGRKQMVGDFNADKAHWDQWNTKPGPEGETVQMLSYDEEGLPIWKEMNMYDDIINGEIRGKFGPQATYGTWFGNLWDSAVVNTIGKLPSASVGFLKWVNDGLWYGGNAITFGAFDEGGDGKVDRNAWNNTVDESDRYWSNWSKWSGVAAPSDIQDKSIFESADSFWWGGGAALGSVAQMIASRNIASSWGKVAGLTDAAAAKAGGYFGSGTMAITAANSFRDVMKQNGISDQNQFLLYGAALVGSFTIERMGGNILDDGLSQFFKRADLDKVLDGYVKESMKAEGISLAGEMTEEQAKSVGKNVWSRILTDSKGFAVKAIDKGKKGFDFLYERSPLSLKAAVEEGREEVVEGLYYNALETVHDWSKNYFERMAGEVDQNDYVTDGNGSFYQVNKLSGTKRRVTEETYNKGIAGQKIQPGKGMFAEYNGANNILSNMYDRVSGADLASDFVLGSFAGGLVTSIQDLRNGRQTSQMNTIQDYVVNGKTDVLYGELAKLHEKGMMGPTDVTVDGVSVSNAEEGAKTMNDAAYESALEQIKASEEIWSKARINQNNVSPEVLKELTSSQEGKDLLTEAYRNMSKQQEIQQQIAALEENLLGAKDENEMSSIKKDIDDLKIKKKDLIIQLDDIRSGDRIRQNLVDKSIQQAADQGGPVLVKSDNSLYVPSASDVKNHGDRYAAQRASSIEKANEAAQQRSQVENQAASFSESLRTNKTDYSNTVGLVDFANEISEIQKKSSEVGLSESGAKNLLDNLAEKRADILKNVDRYFSQEEIEQAKQEGGDMYDETLASNMETAATGTPANSAYEWSKAIDNAIKSFNVEKPNDLQTGDLAQWDLNGVDQFDKPRKITSVEVGEDGKKYAKVEGTETRIPVDQLKDPNFQGRVIKGRVPTNFNERAFAESFYDTYLDTQGNEVSISKTIADLASRTLNDEDLNTLQNLQNGIKNNEAMMALNELVSDIDNNIGLQKYKPAKESILTPDIQNAVRRDLFDKNSKIQELLLKQGKDVADKKNKEAKFRIEDGLIRNEIITMFSSVNGVNPENIGQLDSISRQIKQAISEVKQKYSETGSYDQNLLDSIDPLIVQGESIIHRILNDKNGEYVAVQIFENYKKAKGYGDGKYFNSYTESNEFTISDYADTYNYDGFMGKTSDKGLNAAAQRQFGNIFIANHIQKLKRMDPAVVYQQLISAVKDIETDNGILPSYEQIQVIHSTVAFMVNPDNSVLMSAETVFTGKKPDNSSHLKNKIKNRSLFVRGFAGTGKTSTVLKVSSKIYAALKGGKINIAVAAPSVELQKQIVSSLSSFRSNRNEAGMDYNALTRYISAPNSGIQDTDLIIVDEASSLNEAELNNFQEAIRASKRKSDLKVIYLGDQSQMTDVSQKENAHMPAERTMERTMPTTTVFRSGASDISNLQNAYRNAIFQKKDPSLPKGVYDADKRNGLEYFSGTKTEMYDRFIDDLNSEDDIFRNKTVLIVYKNEDRDAAISYIQKQIDNPNIDLDSKVKTMEKGPHYVQGLEYPRIYVAIEKSDATHLYNKAMLTAVSRASKFDDNNSGFASVMSTSGYSEVGEPLIVSTKTSSAEDIERMNNWLGSIVGDQVEQNETGGMSSEVTQESFDAFKSNIRSLNKKGNIQFNNDGIDVNGTSFRYTIKGKGVVSVTERLSDNISKSGSEKPENQAHAIRGTIIHAIVEAYINKQQKIGGKTFTKKDVSDIGTLISQYNNEAEAWNNTNPKTPLSQIDVIANPNTFEENEWIQEVINNVAAPIASYLNKGGIYALPESIIGVYYNDTAGTVDIIDQVGVENGIPVVDILDLKSLTPGSNRYFGDSNVEGKIDLGAINMPSGVVLPANGLNKALSQLGTYKAILEQGDPSIGFNPVKVRNAVIIKSMLDSSNSPNALRESDFLKYNTESPEFADFKQYGQDILKNEIHPAERDARVYIPDHKFLGQSFENITEQAKSGQSHIGEVTGVFTTDKGTFVEVNIEPSEISMEQFLDNYTEHDAEGVSGQENESTLYNRSALQFANRNSFAFGNASIEVQDGKRNFENDHAKFKSSWLKSLGNRIKNAPSAPKMDVTYHKTFDLLNDSGKLQPFNDVLLITINDASIQQMIPWVRSNYDWANGKSNDAIANEIKSRGYHIMGTMPNPEIDFGKKAGAINYGSKSEVDALTIQIEKGFNQDGNPDKNSRELIAWNKHLAALRSIGAQSENGFITTTILKGIQPGSVVYGSDEQSISSLIGELKSKGFTAETPHWSTNIYERNNSDGTKTRIATWAVNVWKIGKNVDQSTIILRAKKFDGEHMEAIKQDLQEILSIKGTIARDLNNSLAYKFLQQNRSLLIDRTTGQITSEIPGLSDLLRVVNQKDIQLNLDPRAKLKDVASSLKAAIELLNDARLNKNAIANKLRYAIPFTTGNDKTLVIPKGKENDLFTGAKDVHHFGLYIDTSSVDTKEADNTQQASTDLTNVRSLFGKFGMTMEGDHEMADIDENTFASDEEASYDSKISTEGKDNFFSFGKKYFGDVRALNKIKKVVTSLYLENSNYNRGIVAGKDRLFTIEDSFRTVSAILKNAASSVQTSLGEVSNGRTTYTDMSEISGDSFGLLNDFQKMDYSIYQLGNDPEFLQSVIQKIFPSLNIKEGTFRDIAEDVAGKIEGDETMQVLNEKSQTSVMDNIEERDYTETLSSVVQMHINSMELKKYDPITGQSSLTGRHVDPATIHTAMINAAQMSHWSGENQEGLSKMDIWIDNLRQIALDSNVGTDTYNNIMTLIDNFFSEDPSQMSHKYLADNSISSFPGEPTLSDLRENDSELVRVKGKSSDLLLSALYNHFVSVASKVSVDVKVTGQGKTKKYKQKVNKLAVASHVSQNMKSRMNNKLFGINEDGIVVSNQIKEKLEGDKKQFDVKVTGVHDNSGKLVLKFNRDQNGNLSSFEFADRLKAEDIKKMFNVLELKELLYNKTIDVYLSNDPGKLAEIAGMFMATTKLAVDPTWAGRAMVDNYYSENGYEKDSLDSLNDDLTMDMDEAGSNLYKPSDLYRLVDDLAKTQSDVQLAKAPAFFYTVDGKKIFRNTNGSTIHQMFNPGDAATVKASSGIKEQFVKILQDPSGHRYNSLIDDTGNVINTIANPMSNHDIESMEIMGGIQSESKGSRHGKGMTDLDMANMIINGLFVEDLLSNKKIQKVRLPYHNTANKANLPLFMHKFSDKKVFHVTENGIEIDRNWRDQQIVNIFHYHNNARITSVRKWADVVNFLFQNELVLDMKSKPMQLKNPIDENLWVMDPGAMQEFVSQMNKSSVNFSELIRSNPLLVENSDYSMKKGLVSLGNSPLMNIDKVYNYKNLVSIRTAAAEGKLSERIDNLFRQRNYDAVKYLSDIGFELNDKIKNTNKWKLDVKKEEGKAPKNEWSINPTIEAFLFAYHIADHHTSQLIQGDVTQYKNLEDLFKRSTGPVAPRYVPNTSSKRGMGKQSKIAVIEDINGEVYEQLETIFGKSGENVETDGIGFINPISYILMRNSFGGRDLGVMGDGMVKPVYYKNDLQTNTTRYLKYALLNLTDETLANSVIAREAFRKMAGNELYSMWQSGMNMNDLADYVIENGLKDQMIDQAVFTSAVKTGRSGVQPYSAPNWDTSFTIDNDYFGIQLNPTQDVNKTDLSLPTQLMGLIGIGEQNKDLVATINQIRADISEIGLNNINSQFNKDGAFSKEEFFKYLRKMGIDSALKNGEVTQIAEMLENENINMNLPTLGKVKQQLINKLTSEAIKPKWNGLRMSQAPGFFFRIYQDEAGNSYMENEITKYGLGDINSMESMTLQPMKFYSDPEFKVPINSREEFDSLVAMNQVYVRPADVIVPFSYFDKFNMREYAEKNPNFSLNDVFMLQTTSGLINLSSMFDGDSNHELASVLQNEYAQMSQNDSVVYNTFLQSTFESPIQAFDFLVEFNDTLKVINNRVPTSSSSGAFIGKVVGWINDNGNTVYTSSAKNILDGGDYDIDQLNVYFKSVDNNGKIITEGTKGKMNEMFDLTYGYYQNGQNAELYMSPIDLDSIRGSVEGLKAQLQRFVGNYNDWGANLFYYDMIQQGDKLIGVFANVIKNYGYLSHVRAKNPSAVQGLPLSPTGQSETGQFIINTLESFMNAATDNAKELALGILGATEDSGNIIGAGAIKGMEVEEMFRLLKNKAVQDVFKKIQYSKRVDNFKQLSVLDAIENEIEAIKNGDIDGQNKLEQRKKELEVLISNPEAIENSIDQVIMVDGVPQFLSNSQISGIVNARLNEYSNELNDIISRLQDPARESLEKLEALYQMMDLSYLGEAISRLNTVTKMDSNGIPVFDYQLRKQYLDIEFNMGMPIPDFLKGNTPNDGFIRSRKKFMDPADVEKFMRRENAIRSYINIPEVVNELPHIKKYVESISEVNQWFEKGFIKNSPLFNQLTERYFSDKKIDGFQSEQAYYSFYKELDNFMLAIYFSSEYKSRTFQSTTGYVLEENINIGTPEGRYQFGMEFPGKIMDKLASIKAKGPNEIGEEEKLLKDNRFLNNLIVRSMSTGDFLEIKDAHSKKEEDFAELRSQFKLLPKDLQEEFGIYQLIKDGFQFTKGGLYDAMDSKIFEDYSSFLDTIEEIISDAGEGSSRTSIRVVDTDGNHIDMPFMDMFENIFLRDAGYYSDDNALLRRMTRRNEELWNDPKTAYLEPDQHIVSQKKGQFSINKVFDRDSGAMLEGRTSKNFNPYSATESVLVSEQVLRRIDDDSYRALKMGQSVTINFNSNVDYDMSRPLYIRDGSRVKITSKTKNSITISKYEGNNAMAEYQTINNKKRLIQSIMNNSKNDLHKSIAEMLVNNWSDSYMTIGSVNFSDKANNEKFAAADEAGRKVYGYFERGNMNIFINKSQTNTQQLMERAVLHETLHNMTHWALDITAKDVSNLSSAERNAIDRALVFKSDITKLYNAAKEYADQNGYTSNGFKDVHEFVSESFTNPEFQNILRKIEAAEDLKTQNWIQNLWDGFLDSLKKMFGLSSPNSYSVLEQTVGVTSSFLQTRGYDLTNLLNKDGVIYMEDFSNPIIKIEKTKDIINALQPSGLMKNFSEYREEELVNSIFNNIDEHSKTYYYNGEIFYFKDLDEMASKAKIKNEIIPLFTEFENNYKSTMISWLNDGAKETGSLPEKYFPKSDGGSRYNGATLAEIKRLIDYDVNDVYMQYSSFKDQGGHIPFIEQFEGYDPIIVIHKSIDQKEDAISIFDMTSLNLGKSGVLYGNIFKNFVESNIRANRMGINLGNNEGDIRKMLLGLQAMAMKQANPNLQIKHIGVLGINGKGTNSTYLFMNEFVSNMQAMKNIPQLYDSISPEIKQVVDDEDLFKVDAYDQPYIFMLKRKFEERMLNLESIEGQSSWNFKKTHDAIGKIESYLAGDGSKPYLIEIVKNRMNEISREMPEDNKENVKYDKEYQYLSGTLLELTETESFEKLSTKDLGKIKSWYTPVSRIEHRIINWAQEKIMDGRDYVSEIVSNFQRQKFIPLLKSYNERYFQTHPEDRMMDYARDLSGKKFKKLFKTRKVKDLSGAEVEVNSMEIHWDMSDPETQKAVNSNIISKEDVEFGKFIVDSIESEMIENLVHNNRYNKGKYKYTAADAKKELDSKWRKGMIPVMSASVNEMLMKKDPKSVKAGWSKFLKKISNLDDIYDEINSKKREESKDATILREIGDYFMHQIGKDSDIYGSESRMKLMGLTRDIAGAAVLIDDTMNKNMSTNLELITLYMVSSSTRKRFFDVNVVPVINAAQTLMKNGELIKLEGAQPNAIRYLKNYVNSIIKGEAITLDDKIGNIHLDPAINIALQFTTFGSLALNPAVAVGSAVMNVNQIFTNAMSNDVAGNGMFGRKEAAKAAAMLGTKEGRDKIEGIMEMYKVADRSEKDLINNPRRKESDKNVFNSHYAFWMNWLTDYSARGVIAASQMIKDGSIEAYSMVGGELIYNEDKDPRFKGDAGQSLKNKIKERLIEQGYMTSMDERMPRGYENKEARFLKTIADDYVIGSMDDATKTQLSRSTLGRPFMQFRSFLPNKIHRYFGSEKYATMEGRYESRENEAREIETKWSYNVTSGMFTSFAKIFSEVKKGNYRSLKDLQNMPAHDKKNMANMVADLIVGSAMYALYAGLAEADWDDEEKGVQPMLEDSRFLRVIKYSALDMFIWSPQQLIKNATSLPIGEQALRYASITMGDFSEIEKTVPLYSTFKQFKELGNSDNE